MSTSYWRKKFGEAVLPVAPADQRKVEFQEAIREALYALQRDPEEVEYGGALDFEVMNDKEAVERLLVFTGRPGMVPGRVFEDLRKLAPDYEVGFHTHPNRAWAAPSIADVRFFLHSNHQVEMIVADWEILVLTKGPQTPRPPAEVAYRVFTTYNFLASEHPGSPEEKRDEFLRVLREEHDIQATIVPMSEPLHLKFKVKS